MKKSELRAFEKAHAILDKYTDERPVQDIRELHRMDEAYDGLSGLLYFYEQHPPVSISWWSSIKTKLTAFYTKHALGL